MTDSAALFRISPLPDSPLGITTDYGNIFVWLLYLQQYLDFVERQLQAEPDIIRRLSAEAKIPEDGAAAYEHILKSFYPNILRTAVFVHLYSLAKHELFDMYAHMVRYRADHDQSLRLDSADLVHLSSSAHTAASSSSSSTRASVNKQSRPSNRCSLNWNQGPCSLTAATKDPRK